jgi:hypothetical protein
MASRVRAVRERESPVHPPAFSCSAGFSVFALAGYAGSRSITTLAHRFEQGSDCSPAERCVQYRRSARSVGLILRRFNDCRGLARKSGG